MLRLVAGESVQWMDGDRHYVGKVLCGCITKKPIIIDFVSRLVKVESSGEIVEIWSSRLSPYHSEPISEPDSSPVNVGPVS